jgi:hypothetical protein
MQSWIADPKKDAKAVTLRPARPLAACALGKGSIMSLFANNRVRRVGFVLLFLAMIGFDYAKGPVETFLANRPLTNHEDASDKTVPTFSMLGQKKSPALFEDPGTTQLKPGRQHDHRDDNILAFASAYGKAKAEAERSGRSLSEADTKQILLDQLGVSNPTLQTTIDANAPLLRDILYIITVGGMSLLTYVMIIWMTTGRIRDIGWHQSVSLAVLFFYFAPLVLGKSLPAELLRLGNPVFLLLMLVLAVIPSKPADHGFRLAPARPSSPAIPTRRKPGQFGRLGMN